MDNVTQILSAIRTGDERAAEQLLTAVYSELRRMAAARMATQQPGQTLQATVLVHDAWQRLGAGDGVHFESRAHFFGAAAQAMRQIIVDCAVRRNAAKRGGGVEHLDIADIEVTAPKGTDDEVLAVHQSLDRLAAVDSRKAELVKLRYFVGLSITETAALLSISVPTANRDWAYSRAWLHQDILAHRGG